MDDCNFYNSSESSIKLETDSTTTAHKTIGMNVTVINSNFTTIQLVILDLKIIKFMIIQVITQMIIYFVLKMRIQQLILILLKRIGIIM